MVNQYLTLGIFNLVSPKNPARAPKIIPIIEAIPIDINPTNRAILDP